MSRPYYAPKQTYTGNGSVDTYTFDFKIESKTQLLVIVLDETGLEVERVRGDDLVFISSVTFDIVDGGGSVVLQADLPNLYRIGLFLDNNEPGQIFEFSNKRAFNLKRLESALDYIVGPLQRLTLLTKQAFRLHEMDDQDAFDTTLPPGISDATNYNRTFAVNETGTGLKYGPTTDTIDGAVAAAQTAVDAANAAYQSEQNAAQSEQNAAVSETNAEFYARLFTFQDYINIDDTDSPVSPTEGDLYLADDTNADIDFNLPPIASVPDAWRSAIIKQSSSSNTININADGSDTVEGVSVKQITDKGIGAVVYKLSATNWGLRYFAFTDSTGLNSLPPGGASGAALVKNSVADGDVGWEDFVYNGYSSRFNTSVNLTGLKQVLDYILNITYLGPLIASFTGSSNVLREKGTSVSGIALTVNVTKRSNNIARIVFKQGGVTFEDNNPPSNTGSGNTVSSTAVTPFTDNTTFSVEVTDAIVGLDGGNTVTASVNYSFVYPYYYGSDVPGLTPAQVATLTKSIVAENTSYNRPFTPDNGDVFYFAYPAAYGNLISILDENGFETFSSWTKTTANITGLDASAVSYNIYEYNNPVVAGSTNFTFKQ